MLWSFALILDTFASQKYVFLQTGRVGIKIGLQIRCKEHSTQYEQYMLKLFQGSSALSSMFLQNGPVFVEKMVNVGRLITVSNSFAKAELTKSAILRLFNDRSDLPSRDTQGVLLVLQDGR